MNLPSAIWMEVFSSSVSFEIPLVTDVEWRADKRLKSYVFHNYAGLNTPEQTGILATSVRVQFDYSADSRSRPKSCSDELEGFDASGRLRRIRATSIAHEEKVLYDRWYTWKADQIAAVDVCYSLSQRDPYNEMNALDYGSFDGQKRLVLNKVKLAGDELSLNNLSAHAYAFNQSGRRDWEQSSDDWWGSAGGWKYTYTGGTLLARREAGSASGSPLYWGGETTYDYDADGRQIRRNAGADSNGLPTASVDYGFLANTGLGGGGIDVALRVATLNVPGSTGVNYQYFYDTDNKRIQKKYPNDATEDFFYDLEKHLIAERSFAGISEADGALIWDEYIYLGGFPIAMVRSAIEGRSSYTRIVDFGGDEKDLYQSSDAVCPRRNEWGFCAISQIVPDYQGKPILTLDHHDQIMGVGEYDAYGFRNRVQIPCQYASASGPFQSCASSGAANNLGKRRLQDVDGNPLNVENDFRLRVAYLDAPPPCSIGTWGCFPYDARVELNDSSGNAISFVSGRYPNMVSAWVTGVDFSATFNRGDSTQGNGAVLEGYEYDRRTGPTRYFPPLRFPGQYYDAETDLHENWNRFYDPTTSDYLSPEPLLQNPVHVRSMMQYGISTPPYVYAANNPIRYVDPNGLFPLPADPTSLPTGWVTDPSHRDPNGQRFRHPSGDYLDFHRGRPGLPGWRGRDHWHHNGSEEHLQAGDEIPDVAECREQPIVPMAEHPWSSVSAEDMACHIFPSICPGRTPSYPIVPVAPIPLPIPVPLPL